MRLYKCSETEVHRVLAKVLRNAPAKMQRKKKQTIATEEEGKKSKTGNRCDDEENLTDIE